MSFKQNKKNITLWVVFLLFGANVHAQNGFTRFHLGNSGIPDNSVYAVYVSGDGDIWVGTDNGLGRFDGSAWQVFRTDNSGLPSNYVRSIVEDDSGRIWVGTAINGMARFDGSSWLAYNTGNSNLPDDFVRCLAALPDGGILAGTTGGLAKWKNGTMTTYNFMTQGSESNNVASIAVQDSLVYWLGMVNGGLIRLSDTGFVDYTIHNSALTDNTVLGIAIENDDLWMASPANGVIYYWNLAFITYHPFNSGNPSATYSSAELDGAGDIWFGSLDSGLVHYDRSNWRTFNTQNSTFPQDYVRCIEYDSSRNALWVGTHSEGLAKVDLSVVLQNPESMEGGNMSLFPLPAKSILHIVNGPPGKQPWKLSDIHGKVCLQGMMIGGNAELNVDQLPNGIYILQIENQVTRFSVQR